MQTYRTRDGDVVDDIVWRQYGVVNAAILAAVLEANPGLADHGPELPAGVDIALPDIAPAASAGKVVTLWS